MRRLRWARCHLAKKKSPHSERPLNYEMKKPDLSFLFFLTAGFFILALFAIFAFTLTAFTILAIILAFIITFLASTFLFRFFFILRNSAIYGSHGHKSYHDEKHELFHVDFF